MKIEIAKVTSKDQITIPKNIRELLGVEAGDEIVFLSEDTRIRIIKKPKDWMKAMDDFSRDFSVPNIVEELRKSRKEDW